jgi:outer membrane protein assembly factor BamB
MRTVLPWRALVLLAGWVALGGVPTRAAEPSDWLLSPQLLRYANLKPVWQNALPLKKGEKLESFVILGDRLYVRTDQNYMWSLDRTRGDMVFSRSISPHGTPVLGLTSYANRLITVIGNQLVELDEDTGDERRVSDLELSIIAPVVRNSQFFYVSAADGRLHVLRAKDLVQIFEVAPGNGSLITSVIADDSTVVFETSKGNLVAFMPDAPRQLWRFDAPLPLAGPVVRDDNSFYFASRDTNVYRVDAVNVTTASLLWKYQTEALLDCPPLVTGGFVYQYAHGRGLTAIVKQTGQAAWSLPEGVDLLAEAGNKAYVLTGLRTLVVMDNAAGRKVCSVNFAPVVYHAANTADGRIYVADETGRVACLEPTL